MILLFYLGLGMTNFVMINNEISETNTWFDLV